jgi:hypothetical protein
MMDHIPHIVSSVMAFGLVVLVFTGIIRKY